jgi:hypothetical protein
VSIVAGQFELSEKSPDSSEGYFDFEVRSTHYTHTAPDSRMGLLDRSLKMKSGLLTSTGSGLRTAQECNFQLRQSHMGCS